MKDAYLNPRIPLKYKTEIAYKSLEKIKIEFVQKKAKQRMKEEIGQVENKQQDGIFISNYVTIILM